MALTRIGGRHAARVDFVPGFRKRIHEQFVGRPAGLDLKPGTGEGCFRLRWTADDCASARDSVSQTNGLDIGYVDLIELASPGMSIEFTFFRIDANHWEGRNYIVAVR